MGIANESFSLQWMKKKDDIVLETYHENHSF